MASAPENQPNGLSSKPERPQEAVAESAVPDKPQKKSPLTLKQACAFRDQLELSRARQDPTKADPWVVRKFSVLIVVAVYGYALYVFLVRLLIPMIRRDDDARGSRTEGITLLVFWCILWIMFVWTYLRVIFTPPGFAKDHIQQTEEPEAYDYEADYSSASSISSYSTIAGQPYHQNGDARPNGVPSGTVAKAVEGEAEHSEKPVEPPAKHETDIIAENEPSAGALGPLIGQALRSKASTSTREGESTATTTKEGKPQRTVSAAISISEPPDGYSQRSVSIGPQRKPPPYAVLTESYRWCSRCRIVKPYRAHHCRHCGTCVLKMDHHCPWIGTCVGARNYKYFFNFLQWSTLFCLYVFLASLLAVAPPSRPAGASTGLDGRQISLVIIAGLFASFTGGMLGTHYFLITHNITTIEEMAITRMKKRENAVLQLTYGFFDFKGRSQTRKRWNQEWGTPHKEGNLWWLGGSRKNWEMVMGQPFLPWILPIAARPGDDGLHYEPNPRFSDVGRQRMRQDWPEQLR